MKKFIFTAFLFFMAIFANAQEGGYQFQLTIRSIPLIEGRVISFEFKTGSIYDSQDGLVIPNNFESQTTVRNGIKTIVVYDPKTELILSEAIRTRGLADIHGWGSRWRGFRCRDAQYHSYCRDTNAGLNACNRYLNCGGTCASVVPPTC